MINLQDLLALTKSLNFLDKLIITYENLDYLIHVGGLKHPSKVRTNDFYKNQYLMNSCAFWK
ncbi:hypothetical protein DKG77_03210 [Flagellimonas aquimarina]|uniref:Uncharacterized protein n=1 Tax=Flagellimonas aquimarina TaxID=2201895 RepID=A0A316L070_9FLAO|nr:hypothetical protein DKG77_03210 [Allomuricauda koreensis]